MGRANRYNQLYTDVTPLRNVNRGKRFRTRIELEEEIR